MGALSHEEQPRNPKRSKFLAATLKDVFSNCHGFNGRQLSASGPESSDSDNNDEEEEVVSEIRSRAMEKKKRRPGIKADSFSWVFSPSIGEIYITTKQGKGKEKDGGDEEGEDFLSVKSCFSFRSSDASEEAFLSVKTNFSRSSSLSILDSVDFCKFNFEDFRRRSLIQELCHCEGWPFGLCRRLVLLPPLPKSPSDSWSWRKGRRMAKTPYV